MKDHTGTRPAGQDRPIGTIVYRAAPLITLFLAELLTHTASDTPPSLLSWLANLLWYIAFYFLASLLSFSHRSIGAAVTAFIFFMLPLISHYTLRFRGRLLVPADLIHGGTAANVVRSYNLMPDAAEWVSIALFLLFLFLLLRFPVHGRSTASPLRRAVLGIALLGFFAVFLFTALPSDMGIEEPTPVTEYRGFINEFMINLRYSFLHKPEDYSEDAAEDLQDEVVEDVDEADEQDDSVLSETESVTPTNILIIMNESLADYSIFPGFEASEDPLSFYHSLIGTCITGYAVSPVYGGGTANAEYEVLTSNSCAFLPDGSVAYETYLDSETPSLASFAEEAGYEAVSFHPFLASSWNREEAYDLLGFDRQLYQDDVSDPEYIGDYITDACDFEKLEELTEQADGNLFIFNVTIQNHGGYEEGREELNRSITLSDELSAADEQAQTYINLVKASDDALQDLIAWYSSCSEPTLICMFGDHQPSLSDDFYDILYGKSVDDRTGRELLMQYMTPFVIWANYDIDVQPGLIISMPELGILLSDTAGFPRSYYTAMLAEIYEDLPVIHRYGILTSDGSYAADRDSLNASRREMVDSMEMLQYHSLFDRIPEDDFYEPDEELTEP